MLRNRLARYRSPADGKLLCSRFLVTNAFSFIPGLGVAREYALLSWRSRALYLVKDALSALAVFLMCVPRSMAAGVLGGIGPIYGDYTSTYSPLIYFLFGSSRHVAIGEL